MNNIGCNVLFQQQTMGKVALVCVCGCLINSGVHLSHCREICIHESYVILNSSMNMYNALQKQFGGVLY